MKFPSYLVCFLFATPLMGGPKEVPKSFYDNGNVKESVEVVVRTDGKRRVIMKNFYPDGTLKLEMPIVEAGGELGYAPEGVMKAYYPNGKMESSVEWKGNKRNGPFELLYQDGSLRERGVFADDVSKSTERFTRSHEKLALEPCLIVDADKSTVVISEDVVLQADNYHDTGAHLGWVFGYRLVGKEWEKVFQKLRGDTVACRETKTISVSAKELVPGEWQFAVTSSVRGAEYTEARSKTIRIEQVAIGDGDKPSK